MPVEVIYSKRARRALRVKKGVCVLCHGKKQIATRQSNALEKVCAACYVDMETIGMIARLRLAKISIKLEANPTFEQFERTAL